MKGIMKKLVAMVMVMSMVFAMCGCGTKKEAPAQGSEQPAESAAADESAAAGDVIKVAVYDNVTQYIFRTFADQGAFKDAGVNLELTYFADYADALMAFNSGNADMIGYAIEEVATPVLSGKDCKIIAAFDASVGFDGIAAVEGINSLEDLKGKTVASEVGTIDDFLLVQGLKKYGMTEADMTVINMSSDEGVAAISSGTVDALATVDPLLTMGAKNGSVIYSSADDPDLIIDVFVVDGKVYAEKYDQLKTFVKTWYECSAKYSADPAAYNETAAGYGNITTDEFLAMMDGVKLLTLEDNEVKFTKGEGEKKYFNVLMRMASDFLFEGGYTDTEITDEQLDSLIDGSIVNELLGK